MAKKTVNQNTRLDEETFAFLGNVANRLGTHRSDIVRRMVWKRCGVVGAAEALRNFGDGPDQQGPTARDQF